MNYDYLESDPDKSNNYSMLSSYLQRHSSTSDTHKIDTSGTCSFPTSTPSYVKSINISQSLPITTPNQNIYYMNSTNSIGGGINDVSTLNVVRPLNSRNISNFNRQNFSSNAPTPTLVRIGLKPTGVSQVGSNIIRSQLPSTRGHFQPIQYLPEDITPFAKRLRISLTNQQRRVAIPSIKAFHSENDIVSNLVTYHLCEGEPFPSDHDLDIEENSYKRTINSLANKTNDIIKQYNHIVIPQKRKFSDDIQVLKLFLAQERSKLASDIRFSKTNVQQYINAPPSAPKSNNDDIDFFSRSDVFGFSNPAKLF